MSTLLYFAYGSNLHPVRLGARVRSARLLARASLGHHILRYHKRGACGSGKCNAFHTGRVDDRVLGVIYEIAAHEKLVLDGFEGEGYACRNVQVIVDGRPHMAYAYLATASFIDDSLRPYSWYQALVEHGARYHDFSQTYIETHIAIETRGDPDVARHRLNEELLACMSSHNVAHRGISPATG